MPNLEQTSDPQPTRVRYSVIGLLATMAFLLYLDRFCIAAVTPRMIADLRVTNEEFGRAVGIFFFAYALMQIPAGWLIDRFGGRIMLTCFVVGWSLSTITTGFISGLGSLMLIRVCLGVTQAGAYPAAAAILRKWTHPEGRAFSNSLVSTGGRIGALVAFIVTPLCVTGLIVVSPKIAPWRGVFWLFGTFGLVWAGAWWRIFRNSPSEHPHCNPLEAILLQTPVKETPLAPSESNVLETGRESVSSVFFNRNIWLLSAINFFENIGWVFLVTWLNSYLQGHHARELEKLSANPEMIAGFMTAAVTLSGIAGNLSGGAFSDWLRPRVGPTWCRRIPGLIDGCGVALMYFAATITTDMWLFLAEMAVVAFLIDLGQGPLWATYQDIGGSRTGMTLATANMCGNLGAASCSWMIGYFAGQNAWTAVFTISAICMTMLSVCWLCVNPERTISK